jgi:hypothetical protein
MNITARYNAAIRQEAALPGLLERFLDQPTISRIRRNHGLEHATIHVLSRRYPQVSIVGRSDARGFFLYAQLPEQAVSQACGEALALLRSGQASLAIHPNCGTNYLTAALLATAATSAALCGGDDRSWESRLARLPLAVMLSLIALILAQPLGTMLQYHITTEGAPGGLDIIAIRMLSRRRRRIFRVLTSG